MLPRPLTPRESEVLDFMLAGDDARLVALRAQREGLQVVRKCDCGCATVHFAVDRLVAGPADDVCSPFTEARRRQRHESDQYCDLILFLEDGFLSSLEIVWYVQPLPEFPPASEFESAFVRC